MNDESYDIAFSVWAGRDLKNIRSYLTRKASSKIATKILNGIFDAIETTRKMPTRYRKEPL